MNEILKKYMNIKSKFEVKNESTESASIYIYGSIGGWFSETNAKEIRRKLNGIESNEINVHINSPGGDVFDSIAIHNLLKNHKAKVTIHIDGLAASGASLIAMAGDKIIMPSNTMLMIHRAWTYTAGNAEALRKVATDLEKIDSSVTKTYMNRFVGEQEELEQLLADETFLTAEECLALGLCDEIAEEITLEEEEEEVVENVKNSIVAKYSASLSQPSTPEPIQQVHNDSNEKIKDTSKLFESFLNAFTK
nr:hypothetical protein 12 [Bacillaceae bacterium]